MAADAVARPPSRRGHRAEKRRMNSLHEPENNPTVAHESTDADERAITKFGIALVFIVVLSQLVLWWFFAQLSKREQKLSPPVPAMVKIEAPKQPPEPRL